MKDTQRPYVCEADLSGSRDLGGDEVKARFSFAELVDSYVGSFSGIEDLPQEVVRQVVNEVKDRSYRLALDLDREDERRAALVEFAEALGKPGADPLVYLEINRELAGMEVGDLLTGEETESLLGLSGDREAEVGEDTEEEDDITDLWELIDGGGEDAELSFYMREGFKAPLLSAEEERDLTVRVEEGKRAFTSLAQKGEIDLDEVLLRGEEPSYGDWVRIDWRIMKQKLEDRLDHGREKVGEEWLLLREAMLAREQLTLRNTRWVVKLAKEKSIKEDWPLSWLIPAGKTGLMKGIDRFDVRRGKRLNTYATWWIRQEMGRAMVNQGYMIRKPVHVYERLPTILRVQRELGERLGRLPRENEIAVEVTRQTGRGIEVETVRSALSNHYETVPFELEIEGEEVSLEEVIEDTNAVQPFDAVAERQRSEVVREVLEGLTPREAMIVKFRLGEEMTFEEIGDKIGLSRQRVTQIWHRIIGKLRHPEIIARLKDFKEE